MTDVEFTEEKFDMKPRPSGEAGPQGLYKLVINLKLAKDEKQARTVLIVIAILAIVIAVAFPFVV